MGIEYYLVNHKNKTLFELGKGPWYDIMSPSPEEAALFLYKDSFVKHFVDFSEEYFSKGRTFDADDKEKNNQYYTKLANMLFDFIDGADPEKDLATCSDCTDEIHDLRDAGYMYLGTRYTGIKDYNDYIIDCNRHLKSVDLSKIDFTWPISRIRKLLPFM